MIWILYTLTVNVMAFIARVISPFNSKVRLWIEGRKDWEVNLKKAMENIRNPIWIHCSSLGEFEQGRPVIEAMHEKGEQVILTFFSPSGYNNLKDYKYASYVTYLPLDTSRNAEIFIKLAQPKAVLFVKYEFWFNFIRSLDQHGIPMFLISGIFRREQYFFRFLGRPFAKMLNKFTYYFVQNEESKYALNSVGIDQVEISGDTRFDRVMKIKKNPTKLRKAELFIQKDFVLVAGSTWPEDEAFLIKLAADPAYDGQIIIAPHDVSEERITSIVNKCNFPIQLYSNDIEYDEKTKVMIIDEIGVLSSLYQYASVAYIGGGLGRLLHNTLEAAVFGIPLVYGPNYSIFIEAIKMVEMGGAVEIDKYLSFSQIIYRFKNDKEIREQCGRINLQYVKDQQGATEKVIKKLQELNLVAS